MARLRMDALPEQRGIAMHGEYLLDSAAPPAGQRFYGLEATFDGATCRYLTATGVTAGWSCWEIGAGGGSIARWLAGQVAPGGSVLATDLEIKWMPAGPAAVRVERHDVTSDPIPQNAYDLIHARLVLVHLPARDRIVAALAAALISVGRAEYECCTVCFQNVQHSPGCAQPRAAPAGTRTSAAGAGALAGT